MQELSVVAREAFFIKKTDIGNSFSKFLLDKYTYRFYEQKACDTCEWRIDRHSDTCDDCAAYKGGVSLAKEVKINETKYLSVPAGDLANLKQTLKKKGYDVSVKYKYKKNNKFSRPIKFTGTLKSHQEESVAAIMTHKRGVIKAAPRSGKTVLSTAAACMIGKKTIIIAAQRAWLLGFQETFVGSKTQKALTNAKKSQVSICKTYEDFVKHDVCLCTPHTFRSEKGKKLLRRLRDMFYTLIVDEVHGAAANAYAIALANINTIFRIGLSGTPNRKDLRYVIAANLIGPVIYEAKVKRLVPEIRLVRTEYKKDYKGNIPWTTMVRSLESDKKRLRLIARWALKDVEDGHMVMILLSQIKPITDLINLINKIADDKVAYPFHGKIKKKEQDANILGARKYRIKILVGNTKMLSTGVNIPRASCLYEVAMSSNKENAEQRISRILTPFEGKGKPRPIVRFFLDDLNVRKRCMSNEWWQCIKPIFKPIISDKDSQILKGYFNTKTIKEHQRIEF